MSGFVVIVNFDGKPVETALLHRLTSRLTHRGRDAQSLWTDGCVGMGHALQRTTHESRFEAQPATLDGRLRLVANARIDDRADLLGRLRPGREQRLEPTPDPELILRAFGKWGADCTSHLLGDFAFAIWDAPERRLFCARDPVGMRQLYYARRSGSLILSNSLYCIHGHPAVSRRLDDEAIGAFLLFGDHTWHDKGITAFADVRALPPAHCLSLEGDRISVRRYWDFPVEVPLLRYRREADYVEHFRHLLAVAVDDRLRTEAVVIAMSGGMDSSSMAATVRRIGASSAGPLAQTAVSVVYDRVHPGDERAYTSMVAEHLGLPIHFIEADEYPLLEPPVATTRPVEIYNPAVWVAMYREAAEHARVVLEGEGGDTLLHYSGGAGTLRGINPLVAAFDLMRLTWRYRSPPGMGTGLLAHWNRLTGGGSGDPAAPLPYPGWLNPDLESRLDLRRLWAENWAWKPAPLNRRHPAIHEGYVWPDWNTDDLYLNPGFVLPEIRDPYLDPRLLSFVLSLPPLPWLFRKHLLRLTMARDLPQAVLRRPKSVLGALHHSLLAQPQARWVEDWKPLAETTGYVEWGRIPSLRRDRKESMSSYVDLRPLVLDRWIRSMDESLAAEVPCQDA